MAARVAGGYREGGIGFFRKADFKLKRLPGIVQGAAAPVHHERELGIYLVPVVPGQLLHGGLVGLLVTGESDHQIPVGHIPLFLQGDKQGGEDGHIKLVVQHAAPEVEGVILLQLKGVAHPVVGICRHHVHVRGKQNRPTATAAVAPVAHQ